jgi:hypothetical protein
MALRELLSSSQREAIEAIPVDRAGLIEHYVLNEADLNLIRRVSTNMLKPPQAPAKAIAKFADEATCLGCASPTPAYRSTRIPISKLFAKRDSKPLPSSPRLDRRVMHNSFRLTRTIADRHCILQIPDASQKTR